MPPTNLKYPHGSNIETMESNIVSVERWTPVGPKDNSDVLIKTDIAINGVQHSVYGFRVFDPELVGACPPGTLTWDHYDEYGPLLWNIEHGQQFIEQVMRAEKDGLPVQHAPYLPTSEYTHLEDCLDTIISTFRSDYALTPPRIIIDGQAYILALIPSSQGHCKTGDITLTESSWLPYLDDHKGYRETLIKLNDHLLKIKAFEVLVQTKRTGPGSIHSTGSPTIKDWLEQHRHILNAYNTYAGSAQGQTATIKIEQRNYLLFGLSAVEKEERVRYQKYREEIEVGALLPPGIAEYRFDIGMPKEWGIIIDTIAEDLKKPQPAEEDITYLLTPEQLEESGIDVPRNPLEWLNNITSTAPIRYARWYQKDEQEQVVKNPKQSDLSLEWRRTSKGYVSHISETVKTLLTNKEKGAATRSVESGDPLRIPIGKN